MSVSKAVAHSVRTWLDLSAARFGQARAITNARHEATRMSRQRVEREDVRLFLDGIDAPSDPESDVAPPRRDRA